jgi:hypothetical protein
MRTAGNGPKVEEKKGKTGVTRAGADTQAARQFVVVLFGLARHACSRHSSTHGSVLAAHYNLLIDR